MKSPRVVDYDHSTGNYMMPWWSDYWEHYEGVLYHDPRRALWFWEVVEMEALRVQAPQSVLTPFVLTPFRET